MYLCNPRFSWREIAQEVAWPSRRVQILFTLELVFKYFKGAMSPHTHAQANENKLEKVGPTFSSCVGDFGRLFLSV